MKGKRVLFISQEIHPYLPENPISSTTLALAKKTNDSGQQVRVFMPRFGVINERRHQLHEVIRLSGMNVVINDMDMPLIIKVASVPGARMQVYFIDNEEYFKRKFTYTDENGDLFSDNDERTLFFSKGAIDTVEKLGWKPDIIHIHGWMSALVPMYLELFRNDDPLFKDAKVVFSAYNNGFDGSLGPNLKAGLEFDEIDAAHTEGLEAPTKEVLQKLAAKYADLVVLGEEGLEYMQAYCEENNITCVDGTTFPSDPGKMLKVYESLLEATEVEK